MTVPPGKGAPNARIMLVGEAWGEKEEEARQPFVGPSGQELNRMLQEAGLSRSDCYVTNLVNARPPRNDLSEWIPLTKTKITHDMVLLRGKRVKPIILEGYQSLLMEISLVRPSLIIAFGNSALWALTGLAGITKWRGSLLEHQGIRVVPTYHPAAILRMWDWRKIAVHDLRRAAGELEKPTPRPKWQFRIRPTLTLTLSTLDLLLQTAEEMSSRGGEEYLWLDFDIETVAGHIRCFAISWSRTDALCVPLMYPGRPDGYWSLEEEALILHRVHLLLTHPRVKVRGQNLLYDFQYVHRHWHYIPNLGQDTMLSHHVLYAGLPKSLAFQASLYCDYFEYWKDMGKESGKEGE